MQSDRTPEEIAKGLTKAQREAVQALHGLAWKTWPDDRLREMMEGLGKHGLSVLRDKGIAVKGPPWSLTPLGLSVRAILKGQSDE